MRVDIKPQWRQLANWYWDTLEGKDVQDKGMSIWEMLNQNYGASKGYSSSAIQGRNDAFWVHFPDEQSYMMFLLKWS